MTTRVHAPSASAESFVWKTSTVYAWFVPFAPNVRYCVPPRKSGTASVAVGSSVVDPPVKPAFGENQT